jgi:hypothetical protein
MQEGRIEELERLFSNHGTTSDWMGPFIDTHVTILSSGKMRLAWSGAQRVQPEAPADATCTCDLSGQIRYFQQDLRPEDARRIPSTILFRRATVKIQEMLAAALDDGPISAQDAELRRELADERAASSERERQELLELGIDPNEIDGAFEVVE